MAGHRPLYTPAHHTAPVQQAADAPRQRRALAGVLSGRDGAHDRDGDGGGDRGGDGDGNVDGDGDVVARAER